MTVQVILFILKKLNKLKNMKKKKVTLIPYRERKKTVFYVSTYIEFVCSHLCLFIHGFLLCFYF